MRIILIVISLLTFTNANSQTLDSLLKGDWVYYQSFSFGRTSVSKIEDSTFLMRTFKNNDTVILNMSGTCLIKEYYKGIDSILILGKQIFKILHLTNNALIMKCFNYSMLNFGYVEGYYKKENPAFGKLEVEAFIRKLADMPSESNPFWNYIPYGTEEGSLSQVVNIPPRFEPCNQETDILKIWNCHLAVLSAYVRSNINYPEDAKTANIEGVVLIAAVVEKDGTIKKPIVIHRIGGGCDEEALRLVNSLPKLAPASRKDEICRTIAYFPICFRIE